MSFEKESGLKTKGSHVVVARDWIDRELGPGAFVGFAKEVGAPLQWTMPMLTSSWYDVNVLAAILELVSSKSSHSVVAITTEIATQNALKDLRGVYSAFLRILNPVNLLRFTPQLWRNYVSFGVATALQNERGFYIGECREFPPHLIEWVCGDWLGFIPTGIGLAGGKVTQAEITKRDPTNGGYVRLEVMYS